MRQVHHSVAAIISFLLALLFLGAGLELENHTAVSICVGTGLTFNILGWYILLRGAESK